MFLILDSDSNFEKMKFPQTSSCVLNSSHSFLWKRWSWFKKQNFSKFNFNKHTILPSSNSSILAVVQDCWLSRLFFLSVFLFTCLSHAVVCHGASRLDTGAKHSGRWHTPALSSPATFHQDNKRFLIVFFVTLNSMSANGEHTQMLSLTHVHA